MLTQITTKARIETYHTMNAVPEQSLTHSLTHSQPTKGFDCGYLVVEKKKHNMDAAREKCQPKKTTTTTIGELLPSALPSPHHTHDSFLSIFATNTPLMRSSREYDRNHNLLSSNFATSPTRLRLWSFHTIIATHFNHIENISSHLFIPQVARARPGS